MKFPSKNIIPVIIASSIAVGSIVAVTLFPFNKKNENSSATLTVVKTDTVQNNITTDFSTTSEDWKKEFSSLPKTTNTSDTITSSTTSITDEVAENLFANYMNLKSSNQNLTDDQENQLVENTLSSTNFDSAVPKIYSTDDIIVTNDLSNTSLRAYANSIRMGALFKKDGTHTQENEMAIVSTALGTQNASEEQTDIAQLDPIIASYKKIIQDSLKVPVPSDIASPHLDLINGFSEALDSDEKLRNMYGDAASALSGLKEYEIAATQIGNSLGAISQYYQNQAIVFNQNENGYGFLSQAPIQ